MRNQRHEGRMALLGLMTAAFGIGNGLLIPWYLPAILLTLVGILGFLWFIAWGIAWFDTATGGENDGWGP